MKLNFPRKFDFTHFCRDPQRVKSWVSETQKASQIIIFPFATKAILRKWEEVKAEAHGNFDGDFFGNFQSHLGEIL